MNLAGFSIRRKVTTFMIYIAMVVFGAISFQNIALDLMPSIEIPIAIIQSSYSGTGPEEMESLVTQPLEQAAARVAGIETISSTTSEGMTTVILEFADGTNMDTAIVNVRESVDMIEGFLPEGASTPMIMAIDLDAMPIIQSSVTGDMPIYEIQTLLEDALVPSLERIEGVAAVNILGGYTNEVVIDTYADALRGYNITVDYIANILRADNMAIPSGELQNGTKTLTVRTTGEFESVNDIENALIPLPTGGVVTLSEIATVTLRPEEITSIAKLNGRDSISLEIQKQSGVNTVETSEEVLKAYDEFLAEYPEFEIVNFFDQADFINLSIQSVMENIMYGILFAVIVLLAFLKNLKTTLVIAVSMPVSLIGTFIIMQALDLTMNVMTLGGMAMGVGMIVDNSVVVLENIYKYREDGQTRFDSCVSGAGEVALSISASTLTTIAVFLPIGLSGGMTGDMFLEFCVTIIALLVSSLVVALTLVPLLCYTLLDRDEELPILQSNKNTEKSKLSKTLLGIYEKALKTCLKFRKTTMIASFVLFAIFLSSLAVVGVELMPASDQGSITVSISLPSGSELEETTEIAEEVMSAVEDIPEIETLFYSSSANSASATITLVSLDERDRSVFEVGDEMRQRLSGIAGAEITVSDAGMTMTGGSTTAIAFTVSGSDSEMLERIANDLVAQIETIEGSQDVKSSISERIPQVNITLDKQAAARFGLTSATVGSAVNAQLTGASATKLSMAGEEIDVIVKGDSSYADSMESLKTLPIPTQMGATVPLDMIADVNIELGSMQISRENQVRTVSITSDAKAGADITMLTQSVQQIIDNYPLPNGYLIDMGGEMDEIIESFTTLGQALIVAIALVYFILASQFESMLLPFIIMLASPLGLAGGLFGLFLTNMPVSMPAFIGVIMLAGIVVNNSIVLIDYIRIREERGEEMQTAILRACPRRIRPVMMTTLTTILGLLPMALAQGENSETMVPMAVVMISGLAISTVVTLVFSPVVYSILKTRSNNRVAKKEARHQKVLAKKIAKIEKNKESKKNNADDKSHEDKSTTEKDEHTETKG